MRVISIPADAFIGNTWRLYETCVHHGAFMRDNGGCAPAGAFLQDETGVERVGVPKAGLEPARPLLNTGF